MTLTLRSRVFLTQIPLMLLLVALGSIGAVLLYRLGNSINAILRENYDSVIAMERLNEALERIDSSFQFALSGREDDARRQYASNWQAYADALRTEEQNITLPGESERVQQLKHLSEAYRRKGDAFYRAAADKKAGETAYYGPGGLLQTFSKIKEVAHAILQMNQNNMEQESRQARHTARRSLVGFAIGLAGALALSLLATWYTVRTILRPIQAVTHAAMGISAGDLDQVVPLLATDELGQLAQAFNKMARHLRDYRHTQSTRLLRAQQTIQATIDAFPDPVIVVDSEGVVETANPASRELLGVTARQKDQAAAGVWVPPEALRQPLTEALRGERDYLPEGFENAILLGASGKERAFLPRMLTIRGPYGDLLGAAILLQDVTRLRLLDQMKSNLVATVSHELKTPLTSIRLAVHLLLEEAAGPLTPKQTELLVDARENSERLLATINGLLDLTRLEQGARQLSVCQESMQAILQDAAETIRAPAREKGVAVDVQVPADLPFVAVDPSRIGTALRNLLDNALTYTEAGGRITLAAAREGNETVLSVADTGVGFPPEYLPHVFEKFFRVPGQSRGSGTGLGLAIVHDIVTALGGTISCESSQGHGTVFRIRLPIAGDGGSSSFVFGHVDRTVQTTNSEADRVPR